MGKWLTKARRAVRLPPTNLKGIDTSYGRRGYRKNPILAWPSGARRSYVKPLPGGERLHVNVFERQRHFVIKTHVDQHDPGRNPLGHVLVDMGVKRRNQIVKIRKR
jgi:hypothetical protein